MIEKEKERKEKVRGVSSRAEGKEKEKEIKGRRKGDPSVHRKMPVSVARIKIISKGKGRRNVGFWWTENAENANVGRYEGCGEPRYARMQCKMMKGINEWQSRREQSGERVSKVLGITSFWNNLRLLQ